MPVKITKVCCQSCGADLDVDETIRFATCNYCNARLEIVHDTSVTHTRILDRIEKTTRQLAGNLKVIELQNDLERLDREWEQLRQSMLTRSKNGELSPPSAAGSIIGGIFAGIVGTFLLLNSGSPGMGFSSIFQWLGLLILFISVASTLHGVAKANTYQKYENRYQIQRHQLCKRIDRERRA